MQHGLDRHGGDSLGQRCTALQVRGVHGIVRGVHFLTDDLAAVQVQDRLQVEPNAEKKGCARERAHPKAIALNRSVGAIL